MGLDITAYSRLKHIGHHPIDPELNEGEPGPFCYYENHVQAYAYDSFPHSFRGIPALGVRPAGASAEKFLDGGCFETTEATQTHHFRAGSYTGYNLWRADLRRQFVTPDPDPNGPPESYMQPFYELVWFADNEGTIGPEAAADLLADFRDHADRYVLPEAYRPYPEIYSNWTRAFELAADGGLVDFH